ncbi:retinoid-inducible serine carboxypeptidase-like [Bombus pascuorum]|uniref:retinoid-inducible serine carboxypeptidase-like n=1 Tax=Bombus pascuorum TaxID=65598 RepID=UPI00213C2BC6|nr:retinoid-inducible serine carboxypeptidase-like [Bombus pascuorum]
MKFSALLLVTLCFASEGLAKKGFGPGEQEWGYVKVRPTSHMFWWLYYTTANVSSYYEKPLIIWLQGGPGASSTSYGNFEELGPLDVNLEPRNFTWVRDYNVLFIDNPVGTGFSYTTLGGFTTRNAEIAEDLLECIKGFLKQLPEFADVPTYITTESYGGKMGAEFALLWYKTQQQEKIKSNLKGVALGDAWISPIDSVMTWAPFLLATGMVDTDGYEKVNKAALRTKEAVDSERWADATRLWSYTEGAIIEVTNNIDFYNILTKIEPYTNQFSLKQRLVSEPTFAQEYSVFSQESLSTLMNGPVKESLNLPSDHGTQSSMVFSRLRGDFMKPVIHIVESLLNETKLKVVVISGHMDLIVDTPGTLRWVEKMQWKDANSWHRADRAPLVVENITEGYVKSYGNFSMYWVNRAGHMVPKDNPAAMAWILKEFTK